MKEHIVYQRLYGLLLMSSFIFLSDPLSLKGKRLDFDGRSNRYVSLANSIPELSRFTACIDVVFMADRSTHWMAFSYITKNTLLGREDIHLGLAGNHQQLILYSLGKVFYIWHHLTPSQWHTICLIWDGVKGKLELFVNKERILIIMDQPHCLTANGTLVLGHIPKNGKGQVKSVAPHFTGSLYYFQLWDHILEHEEFRRCLDGNVVSWEEDIWLVHKIIPTLDRKLRCFVSENMTIQETSTNLSQQIHLTTSSQITGLNPQKTIYSSTVMSKSMPVFITDHTNISHSNATSPPLFTTLSKSLKTSISDTATFTDVLTTSTAITLLSQNTLTCATTDSMKVTEHPSSESTRTTKMGEAMPHETFHPPRSTHVFPIPGVTNPFVPKTSATESQTTIMKTLFSTIKSTFMSATSWPVHKSTDTSVLPIATPGQEFLVSTAAETVPWSTVEETSAVITATGIPFAIQTDLITSTAAPVNSVLPITQVPPTLATTEIETAFKVHSGMPTKTTSGPRPGETEWTPTQFHDASLPSMEDAISTFMPRGTSSMTLSSMIAAPITKTQSAQTVIDVEDSHTGFTPRMTLAPTLVETMPSLTIAGSVYTQNTPTAGEHIFTLISTQSIPTFQASESGSTSVPDETAQQFSTNAISWTSRPSQNLLTSMNASIIHTFVPNKNFTSSFHGNTTDTDHSSSTTDTSRPPEPSLESEVTTGADATAVIYSTTLCKQTSPCLASVSITFRTTSVTNPSEFQLTTSLLETISMSTADTNELSLVSSETVGPSVGKSTDMKLSFPTEESTSETTKTEANGVSTIGDTIDPVSMFTTTQTFDIPVTRKETTSYYLKGKSTLAREAEVSPFSAMPDSTDESTQMMTVSVTVSPFPDMEKLSTILDVKTATLELGGSWLSTKLMETTPKSSYNGTMEIFNSTHTYTTCWMPETTEKNSGPLPTLGSTQTFPKPFSATTTRKSETSFITTPTDRIAGSLSAGIFSPYNVATHFSTTPVHTTHMGSPPINVSAVTSMVVSEETTVTKPGPPTKDSSTSMLSDVLPLSSVTTTTTVVPPLSQTASIISKTMSIHRDSIHTTIEPTVTSTMMTFTEVPSLTNTVVPSQNPLTPVRTKAKSTLFPTSMGTVTPSAHTLRSSKPPDYIPFVSSTHVISTTSPTVATRLVSQGEEISTHALSFLYTSGGGDDVVNLATITTENFAGDEIMSLYTSANKPTTSKYNEISQSPTGLVNTQVSTQLMIGTSTSFSDKEQMSISVGEIPTTMEVTEISPSNNSFIFYSRSTSPLEMTDMTFFDTTEISSHQTKIPLGTVSDGNLAASPNSESTQTAHILTSSNSVNVDISEISTSLPSQALTTTFVPHDKGSSSALALNTPRTAEVIVRSSSVTHPISSHQDTSFVDNATSRTTNTTLSYLPALKTQPKVTSIASTISEGTQTSSKSLSSFTTRLPSANFTIISNGTTVALSVTNVATTLEKTSMETSIPIYQMSSLPVNVTDFTAKTVSDTLTVSVTKSSKTTQSDCLKGPFPDTSGPMSEMSSMPVSDPSFSSIAVSSVPAITGESLSTLLSSNSPMTTMTIQTSTLDVIPVTYTGHTSKYTTIASSDFTNSKMTQVSSKVMPTSVFSPTKPIFPSMKTIPSTIVDERMTPVVHTTTFSPLHSKNTEAIASIPHTTFSSLLSTTQQSSHEVTMLGLLPGITYNSQSTVSSDRMTIFKNTYPRITNPENVFSPNPSEDIHTSLDIQSSKPSLVSFKSTPGPTENIQTTTTYLSSNTGNLTSSSESTFLTTELTKSDPSVNTSVLYDPCTSLSATPPSSTSLLYSLHSTEVKSSTLKTSPPPTSQMGEFPVLGTQVTSSDTHSLLTTSWNTPTTKDSLFPISTKTLVPTPNKIASETLHFIPGSLSTVTSSQTGLNSSDVMTTLSIPTSEIFPAFGFSDSHSSSISSRALPTTTSDIKHPFEKTATSVTSGTTLQSNPSAIAKATTLPTWTWILSNLPSGVSLTTVLNALPVQTSEVSKPTLLTSGMLSAYPFPNFTTSPFSSGSTILPKTSPAPTLGNVATSFPMSTKNSGGDIYISASPDTSSRTTVTDNSRTGSQFLSFSGMSLSPSTAEHTLSVGSMRIPTSTKTLALSRFPAASPSPSFIPPKSTSESLISTTISTTTGAFIPLVSTGVTHLSTTVSSLVSSSFETSQPNSISTFLSTESLSLPVAAESTVSFYNTEMSFSVFDEEPRTPITSVIHEFTKDWLNSIFQDSEFSLTNLAIQIKGRDTSKEGMAMYQYILGQREGQEMATISRVPYSCHCQVIIKANSSLPSNDLISKIKGKIHGNFTHGSFTQDQLTLLVKSNHVVVKKLEPGKCEAEETPSIYKGTYQWLLTNPTETAQTRCIKNKNGNATRICSINIQTGKSRWDKPRFKQCKLLQSLPDKIVDLANVTISDENADDVAEHILNLVKESSLLDEEEIKIIVSKVAEISKCDEISMNLTHIILQIISAVSEKQSDSPSNLHPVSNEILRIIERAGHKMEFSGRTANLTVGGLALAVLRMDNRFEGIAFSACSYKVTSPEIYLGDVPLGKVLASIYLPKSLRERIPFNGLHTLLFNFFGQTSLFKIKNVTKALATYVVSASISDTSIQNLADPVVITLQHIDGNWNYDQVYCAFWDFDTNNGLGGWNSSGCKVKETNVNYTICLCDHLTHFGVLMDLSRSTVDAVNERILVIITYTGCGISSIFLGIAMVTYIAFHKLRKDYPSKILINLCTALLMLNLAFLVNSWLSSFQKEGLCITAAVALHYFLLVSLTWMGLEAVHMYFALVKVFNIYIPHYILKFCVAGWGIPAVTVAVILIVRKDLYGTLSPTTPFCWIKDDSIFYISVVAYFGLIFLMNLSMFCTVLAQLNSVKFQSQKTRRKMILHDLKGTISLTFLLGLTWGFAFFAWGPVRIFFMYLFSICNTLQGFFIFVFYCVMKESVRKQWHMHLHCRWLRLENSSGGSSRCGIHVGFKQERMKKTIEHKLLAPSLKSTATSCTFKSIGSAQGTPSEISFSNDDFDGDPYCFSPSSCKAMPNCLRRILPAEIKMNSIHKQGSFSINLSTDAHLPPTLDWGKC
ncbi:adhesion G-protein coupled receptor G4 [Perognathus longimembris pacificus]|uniref:adhesion G-protein coupled receptor G4 n=1 Tax=Perognathus longimembris pacificus TaxID=214514 RepID=UPI002019B23C|nr:adhesion G-protein coupled receptor G4 [Perognathus longimembris pacificus]